MLPYTEAEADDVGVGFCVAGLFCARVGFEEKQVDCDAHAGRVHGWVEGGFDCAGLAGKKGLKEGAELRVLSTCCLRRGGKYVD